jgi:hypothetical protein
LYIKKWNEGVVVWVIGNKKFGISFTYNIRKNSQ